MNLEILKRKEGILDEETGAKTCVSVRAVSGWPAFVGKKIRIFSQERERRSPRDTAFEDTQLSLAVFFIIVK